MQRSGSKVVHPAAGAAHGRASLRLPLPYGWSARPRRGRDGEKKWVLVGVIPPEERGSKFQLSFPNLKALEQWVDAFIEAEFISDEHPSSGDEAYL